MFLSCYLLTMVTDRCWKLTVAAVFPVIIHFILSDMGRIRLCGLHPADGADSPICLCDFVLCWDLIKVRLCNSCPFLTYFTWHNDLRVHPFCNESEFPSFSWLNNIPIYSLVAQLVNLPAMWETWVQSLGWEDSLEKERLLTLVFWPGEFHGPQSVR